MQLDPQWVTSQGIGAVLAFVMFMVYRKDAKDNALAIKTLSEAYARQQTESATAWMAFGQEQGALMARIAGALERIEERQESNAVCPVTQVTSEWLRDATREDAPQRRRADVLMRQAMRRAADEAPREGQ